MNPISDDARVAIAEQLSRVIRLLENLELGQDEGGEELRRAHHLVVSVRAALLA